MGIYYFEDFLSEHRKCPWLPVQNFLLATKPPCSGHLRARSWVRRAERGKTHPLCSSVPFSWHNMYLLKDVCDTIALLFRFYFSHVQTRLLYVASASSIIFPRARRSQIFRREYCAGNRVLQGTPNYWYVKPLAAIVKNPGGSQMERNWREGHQTWSSHFLSAA